MILVDTSVLVDFLRGSEGRQAARFEEVVRGGVPFGITPFIAQELLAGVRTDKEFERLGRYLATQRFYHPKEPVETHFEAARLYFKCRRKGLTVRSAVDCLIARIAIEHDLVLLENDRDFKAIAKVSPLRLYRN